VTTSASGADLTAAGYAAFQDWVGINQEIVHLVQVHGVTLTAYRRLRADCGRLGPNSDDLEVQAFRSICAGGFDQAFALIRLSGCAKLAVSQRRSCFMGALNTTTAGTQKLLSASNSVLQILDRGACYSTIASGLSLERRLLNTGNQLLSAEQADAATVQAVSSWATAFGRIIETQERSIAAMIKDPALGRLATGSTSSTGQATGGLCQPAGVSAHAGGSSATGGSGSVIGPTPAGGSTPD